MGDVFDQATQQTSEPKDVFDAATTGAQTGDDSLTWDMVKNNLKSIANGTNENINQLKDAAVGAGKTLAKGAGVVGDIATLGLTHLLPGSDKASAGINAKGTALNPTNEDQQYGGYVGDAANFELGSGIFNSLSHLPLAERVLQAAKALKAAQEHPVIAKLVGAGLKGAGEAGAGTLVATGNPSTAATGAVVGGGLGAGAKGIGMAASKGYRYVRDLYKPLVDVNEGVTDVRTGLHSPYPGPKDVKTVQPVIKQGIRDTLGDVAQEAEIKPPTSPSIRDVVSDTAEQIKAKSQSVFQKIDELSDGAFSDAQAKANRYRGSIDKAGKDAYAKALQKQDQIFDALSGGGKDLKPPIPPKATTVFTADGQISEVSSADQAAYDKAKKLYDLSQQSKNAFTPEELTQAKANWKQYRALQEVDDAIKMSTVGQRPEVSAGASPQPTEEINPKMLLKRLNTLYNEGTLENAVGKDAAHRLLQHAGAAQDTIESIKDYNRQFFQTNNTTQKIQVEANRAKNSAVVEANKASNSAKVRGRAIVGATGAAALGGAVEAGRTLARHSVKTALGGQ